MQYYRSLLPLLGLPVFSVTFESFRMIIQFLLQFTPTTFIPAELVYEPLGQPLTGRRFG